MTKENKTVSTIRRRKGKDVVLALQKLKEENASNLSTPPAVLASDSEIQTADRDEKCYMFDDRVLGPMTLRRVMCQRRSLFLSLFAIRCANALLLQTQYVPDEYWQSTEVAHSMVFGYGYLTWEWQEGLRGYSYPLIFAALFKLLSLFGLDSRFLLIKLPRIIQAGIAAWGDFHLYELSARLVGRSAAQWTLLCQLMSWFTIYCCTRTLSNSTEASLMIVALSYFPWPSQQGKTAEKKKSNIPLFLLYAALSVIVRPTAAVVWVLLCCWHLQLSRNMPGFKSLIHTYLIVGLSSLGLSALIDRIWYGRWIFVQINFLWFNVFRGGASIYGTHPWHWYIWQGFPVVMGTLILPFALGVWNAKDRTLFWIALWILATHSLQPHKEFRFILPVIPLAMHYCGLYFQRLCTKPTLKEVRTRLKLSAEKASSKAMGAPSSAIVKDVDDEFNKRLTNEESELVQKKADEKNEEKGANEKDEISEIKDKEGDDQTVDGAKKENEKSSTPDFKFSDKTIENERDALHQSRLSKAQVLTAILAVTNLLPAFYFCLIHQRGTVMVTKFLADAAVARPADTDILFLMPCHSTPYYSYMHANVSMRFLTCDPPGVKAGRNVHQVKPIPTTTSGPPTTPTSYVDEADEFYQSPEAWLRREYGGSGGRPWPSHVVFFSSLHRNISGVLVQSGYKMCASFFHTHFPEGRVGATVLVGCR